MDARHAARNLELIRTLMERTCQYQLLTARAGLAAGSLAGAGALGFVILNPENAWSFGAVWALVFGGSLLATAVGVILRSRERGERVWSLAWATWGWEQPCWWPSAVKTSFACTGKSLEPPALDSTRECS